MSSRSAQRASRPSPYASPRASPRSSAADDPTPSPSSVDITKKTRQSSFSRVVRTASFRRNRRPAATNEQPPLPKNWKQVHCPDGTSHFFNSVTQQRSTERPRELPDGWVASLHKESGRICYTNKVFRKTTFEFPEESLAEQATAYDTRHPADDIKTGQHAEPEGGVLPRRFLSFSRKAHQQPAPAEKPPAEVTRRFNSFSRKGLAAPRREAPSAEPDSGGGEPKTVHISCSALVREVKLCTDSATQPALDSLLAGLRSKELAPQLAVKQLMELVGSVLVQQAGLSVVNARKGVLPHGWIEYADDKSGRSYYFNVHTRKTTWVKPELEADTNKLGDTASADDAAESLVDIECKIHTHDVAVTGFI